MASEYDPLVRTLHSESEEDIALPWCPAEGDHGKCTAYLAQVIAVDQESQQTEDEEETDDYQALGKVGEGAREEISREGEGEDGNIEGGELGLPPPISPTPPLPPSTPLLDLTLSATQECRYDPFIENGVHVTHDISSQTHSFLSSTQSDFVQDDFPAVAPQNDDDMTSYRSTLCIVESEDTLSISEEEEEEKEVQEGETDLICGGIDESNQFTLKPHTPCGTPVYETLVKEEDVEVRSAAQPGDDISDIVVNSGLEKNEANESFSANSLIEAGSLVMSGIPQATNVSQIRWRGLAGSCDEPYPVSPMRTPSFVRLFDNEEQGERFEEDDSVEASTSAVAECELLEEGGEKKDVPEKSHFRQEQNNAEEETKAPSLLPLPLLISDVPEEVPGYINLAHSPETLSDTEDDEMSTEREGNEEKENGEINVMKEGNEGLDDGEMNDNQDRNEGTEIDETTDDLDGNERIEKKEPSDVVDGNERIENEDMNDAEEGSKETNNETVNIGKDESGRKGDEEMIDNKGGNEGKEDEEASGDEDRNERTQNEKMSVDRDGIEGVENEEVRDKSDEEGITGVFKINDNLIVSVVVTPPSIVEDTESDDGTNIHLSSQVLKNHDDSDDQIKIMTSEESLHESMSINDETVCSQISDDNENVEGVDGLNVINDCFENWCTKRDDCIVEEEGNGEITGEIVSDTAEVEKDSEDSFMNESPQTLVQEHGVRDTEMNKRESEAEEVEREHSMTAAGSVHSCDDHNKESPSEGIASEDDEFGLVMLFTKPDGSQHKETSLSRDVHEDVIKTLVSDDHDSRIMTFVEYDELEDRMSPSKRDNDVISPSSSGHSGNVDWSASACDVDIVRTIGVTFVPGEEGFAGQIGEGKVDVDEECADKDPDRDVDLNEGEETSLSQDIGNISVTQFASESEDAGEANECSQTGQATPHIFDSVLSAAKCQSSSLLAPRDRSSFLATLLQGGDTLSDGNTNPLECTSTSEVKDFSGEILPNTDSDETFHEESECVGDNDNEDKVTDKDSKLTENEAEVVETETSEDKFSGQQFDEEEYNSSPVFIKCLDVDQRVDKSFPDSDGPVDGVPFLACIDSVTDLPPTTSEFPDLSILEVSELPISGNSDISEVSDLLISEVQDDPVAEVSDLLKSEVPEDPDLFISDSPDLSISKIPDLSVPEIPGLSISEVQDLAVSEIPDLDICKFEEDSTPILGGDEEDLGAEIHSELETPSPIQEGTGQEIPVIILTSPVEATHEGGKEDNDDSSLSLSDEDELVSSVITVIAADQLETQIEEVDDGEDSLPSASENVDCPSESDAVDNSVELENDEVLTDNTELVKDLSSSDLYLESEVCTDVSQLKLLSEDSFSGWVNQVCSVFCQSDTGFHDTEDRIISVSRVEEEDISASHQVIDEYPSKLRFIEGDEKYASSSSLPVVLNSDCCSLGDGRNLSSDAIVSEGSDHNTSGDINTNTLSEDLEHCNNAELFVDENSENTSCINEEKTEDASSFNESFSPATDDARNAVGNGEEFSQRIASEKGNYISSVIENQVDCIPFPEDDPVGYAVAAVNCVDLVSPPAENKVNDFLHVSENQDDVTLNVIENEEDRVSDEVENQEESISSLVENQDSSILTLNQGDRISPVTENQEDDIKSLLENQVDNITSVFENQEGRISPVSENLESSFSPVIGDHEKIVSSVIDNQENNTSLLNVNQEADISSVTENQEDLFSPVVENRENRISPVIENQEDRISPIAENQEDNIPPVTENQQDIISVATEDKEDGISHVSESQEDVASLLIVNQGDRISPWTESEGAFEDQENITLFVADDYDQNLSENQEFDDSQVYYIPLVDEDQEYSPSFVIEDQEYSPPSVTDDHGYSPSILTEDQESSDSPANEDRSSSAFEDQVDFSLRDRGRLTKYISVVDKDNYNYSLPEFENEINSHPLVIENQENYIQCTTKGDIIHTPPLPEEGEVDLTAVSEYKSNVISSSDDSIEFSDVTERENFSVAEKKKLDEINYIEESTDYRSQVCEECQPGDVTFVTKPQDDNDNLLIEGQSEPVDNFGKEHFELTSADHKDLLTSENRDRFDSVQLEKDSLTRVSFPSDDSEESEDNLNKYIEDVNSQVDKEIEESAHLNESVVSQEDNSVFLSEESEDKVRSDNNSTECDVSYVSPSSSSSLLSEVEGIDFIGGVIGGVKEGWHSLPSSAVEGKLPFDSFLSVIEEEDQIDSIPGGIERDRTDSSPPAKVLDISEEEPQVPPVPSDGGGGGEEEEVGTEEGKEGKGSEGLLILSAPDACVGCVELRSARDDLNSKLPKDEEVFELEANGGDIATVVTSYVGDKETHCSEEEVERETRSERETLLEISRANGNDLDEVSGFNGDSKLAETSEGATVDAVGDTKEELDSFVGSGELQGRSESIAENVEEKSVESVLEENLRGPGFEDKEDEKGEGGAEFSLVSDDEIQTDKLEDVGSDADDVMKANVESVSDNDECEALESASKAKERESSFPSSSFEESLSVSSEMSVDADFGSQLEPNSELTRSDMSESSNRDSGTSYLSEADGSDNDTLVGRNSDGDGMMNSDVDGMVMSSSSSSEEGTVTAGSRDSSQMSDVINHGDAGCENFSKGHRRDDSGVVMGNFPVDPAHHLHHTHQRQQDVPGNPPPHVSHPHHQRAGGANEIQHRHHHCYENYHIADHHCHHHHHHHTHHHAAASDDHHNQINVHKRTAEDDGSYTEPEENNRTLERGISPAQTDPEDDDTGSVKGFARSRSHQFRVARRFSGAKMVKKMKKVVHFGKKSLSDDNGNHPHHTKVQEAIEGESFGKRAGGGGRRTNECLILEPSEMIVIDYPDVQLMRPCQRGSCNTMSLEKLMALEQDEVNIRPVGRGAPPPPPGHHHAHQFENEQIHGQHIPHPHDPYLPDLVMGSGILRGARSRGSVGSSVRDGSDTSSAYSGSDTMCHSLHSSLEPDDVDLSGLTESAVDSDEEDLAESMESLTVRDCVRECLEKDPSERTEDDIEILLEFTQRLQAFSNMTLAVRRDMCQAMVFAVVEDAGTILMHQGEELDSWSVIINGHVEVTQPDGSVHELHLGDSFGITPTMEKLYHQGIMRSKVDDCQFVCIRQTDYYRILHRGEENTRRVEEDGVVVLVTEQRPIDGGNRKGNIVIKGTSEKLMCQLVEVENNVDPTYVEDFLLTHRTFVDKPLTVANKLLHWFEDPSLRDRVTRVVLLWVNNHFTDFEMDLVMMNFLEQFEEGLEREKMAGQLRLLDFACATKARARVVTLTRPSRDEILHFSILGGYERGHGIFISKVEKGSKAEEVGLKRGDQILEVNGQSFDHMNHARALEILRQPCHLSITVKSNLLAFKEMLSTPDNSPRPHARKTSDVRGLSEGNGHMSIGNFGAAVTMASDHSQQSPRDKGKDDKNKSSFMTIGASTAKQFKKKFINPFVPKQTPESHMNSDESVSSQSSVGGGGLYHSHSNPDLSTAGAYEDVRTEFPEHVLKVYRATDHSSRFLPVHKETTAREVVMLALQIFNINDPSGSSNYALYEVTVTEEGITKQKRLPDSLQNLAERIGLSSRYYLKNITVSQTHVPDDIVNELVRESAVCFLQLNSVELAVQLTLEDYTIFRQIEPTEYIDYLFNLKSNYGTPALSQFAGLVNREMFWVVTEVCSEHNLVKRSKIIKQFIKVARQCKECKNFNSMFAILSGLGHGAVSRLKQTWERLPTKYSRMFQDMQDLMDPSRNMSKYRNLVQNENIQSPIIPFYPVVARDLTFTHEGNDDKVDGLINFEKLRMISRYIRDLQNMCSAPYMAAGGHQIATVKRRKKSTAAPDKKKMYEEAQMVRRVKAYLSRLQVVTDEEQLRNMSLECEGGPEGHKAGGSMGSQQNNNNNNGGSSSAPPTNPPPRRRPHSPTPSTTSSTSSTSQTSDGKKQTTKFGATSPQSISKMKALAEPKTKPHHGPRSNNSHHHSLSPSPSPGPPRKGGALTNHNPRSNHERSHSDTHAVPVDLSAESSSVTSLSKLHKSHTSGSVTSNECQVGPGESDSGISTHFDCHSSSSLEVGGVTIPEWHCHSSPPAQHRRYSHQPESRSRPPFPHAIPVLPPVPTAGVCNSRIRRGAPGVPPDYVATQQRMKQMGRALSHDGVQYYHHSHHDDEEEDAQVSAV
ncbi:uncharacterized protein PDZ-GEF isoform X4 [Macrobrachium rosenbergii]|uniref:uncharacterized protein PDZ-GEF isoform X4 n=1 Tax=Macrobrachium rosenbergii TaxID=79674 RepID=UPI0034D5BEAB